MLTIKNLYNPFFLVIFLGFFLLFGCSSRYNKKVSSLTGWDLNDNKGWSFSADKYEENAQPGMVFIEGGTFVMGRLKDDVMHDWNNTPKRMSVRSFYMSETEVTNHDYRLYLDWLNMVFPSSNPAFKEIYTGALPDTLVWANKLSKNDTYVNNYLRHPAFKDYPVVGVSWLQANKYCDWLTDRRNEKILIDKGIISKNIYVDTAYYGTNNFTLDRYHYQKDKMFDDDKLVFTGKGVKKNFKNRSDKAKYIAEVSGYTTAKYRLPTEAEWEYAALAMPSNREYNKYKGKIVPETNLRVKKGGKRGDFLANFKIGRGDQSGVGGWNNQGYAITSPVKAYPPNGFGLYDMLGNVAEWVADVYRPIVDDQASDFNYFRGNVFDKVITVDGKASIVGVDIIYDTLRDGRLVYKQLPGSLKREAISHSADYLDGDSRSALDPFQIKNDEQATNDMYNSPKRKFIIKEGGRLELIKDSAERITDISNETRVIKGGSWTDRAYWLDPSLRRYKNQTDAFSWVGFRVATDVVGSDKAKKRKKRGI